MTRNLWLGLAVALTAAALAATFVFEPGIPRKPAGPQATPLGWAGQLQLRAGDGVLGLRDGLAAQARFADPYGLALGRDGTLYVADAGDNNRIRAIRADGRVVSLAGSSEGFRDGIGAAAAFNTPSGVALDAAGNLYIADTGNHAIRKLSPQGVVSTLAGDGSAGYLDGPAAQARFNGPTGVAVDAQGRVYVADTYNDRIRVIGNDGQVRTLAGGERPGYQDGPAALARFDTPTALALDRHGRVLVADLRNNAIRRIGLDGVVSTVLRGLQEDPPDAMRRPLSLAVTHDGVIYVGEMARGRVLQIGLDRSLHTITDATTEQRLARPSALALAPDGALYVADAQGYRVHRIAPVAAGSAATLAAVGPSPQNPLPRSEGRWPLAPQDGWHEVVGTMAEVRGDGNGEARHHLHDGLDIAGDVGQRVLAIADAKLSSPNGTWGMGALGEGMSLDTLSYIHMRVGRDPQGNSLDPSRFHPVLGDDGKPERIRVLRGTRFRVGDALGTINPMAHVHLVVGASGYQRNAITLGFVGYTDRHAPQIERVALLDDAAQPLEQREQNRVLVSRGLPGVQIVVDAWDQVDRNQARRRLGLYSLGYQWLDAAGAPLPGYESPRTNLQFDRMPSEDEAVQVVYADGSGVTVHGSAITRFRYVLTNTARDGRLVPGLWTPTDLPPGDYTLRITAKDYSGNVAAAKRDLDVRLQ
ncbi:MULTISPECIES: NHL repeat-containing protein [unclassified Lysobacter]|uniref:NHL repeat-containing protein n=1 Tax=unclassified Lysobacter TaxID=2635362 RepID=UPI0006FB94FB|nr:MULTISPECIES: NHL repeat-containing protein [unclassified Lysobacter]KQZ66562.1 gluconolaconase [Lysobacter sp. Root559]KRC32714.1 gluconolaconase [Lysobacter sp. Root76]KRD67942.1 gluconolaconase [Lysobacter sp. Root96]